MDDRLDRIGRLAEAARGLEREGAYNGAKLVRAVLESELIRYAEAEAPTGAEHVAAAVETLVADLGPQMPPGLAPIIVGLAEDVRAGRTIPLADAPRCHVCRTCGAVLLGEDVPLACPECEAPTLSYREILPVWYLEPADRGAILAALGAGQRHRTEAIAGRDDDALARPPARGEWSARETLEHLLYAEELFATRIERLLAEDEPDLAARAVWAETTASDEGSAATGARASEVAARIHALRSATLERLDDLPEAAWGRGGMHPEWGRVTVLSQAAYFARHESSHLPQLAAAAAGRLPGRGR
jgi:uncharacterized damage-inducible protein DinB